MATYKFTNNAVKDLTAIWEYTRNTWSEKQADHYYRLLIEACSDIAKDPKSGKDYPDIYPGLKGKRATKHILFYRLMPDKTVEIIRILHERMDLKGRLKK